MLIVTAYSQKDWAQAVKLYAWIAELDASHEGHECLLMASENMEKSKIASVETEARKSFSKVYSVRSTTRDERGWPYSCNTLFRTAVKHIERTMPQPFWWNEPDCIPVKSKWLDDLAADYELGGRPFMGVVYQKPFAHLAGCAVYPANICQYNPDCLKEDRLAWDVVAPEKTIPHVYETELFQHEWGNIKNNIAPTFPTLRSLDLLNPNAVVFHRNKDGTLIDRLREKPSNWKRPFFKSNENGFQEFDDRRREKRHIKNVTLVAIDGTSNCNDTLNSMIRASSQAAFDDCILFSTQKPKNFPPWIRYVKIAPLTLDGYNRFCLQKLHQYIQTTHCLTIQSDSGINNPDEWNDSWLKYDYIGAPWPEGWAWAMDKSKCARVGNSGFCLRSVKLLRATASLPNRQVEFLGETIPRCVDDVITCVMFRKELERLRCNFAPVDVAARFAFELPTKEESKLNGQFGFHLSKKQK